MDVKTEADLFITINHEQRSVSKSLLVTLQADLKLGSGDPKEAISALGSALVRSLSNDNTSPFFRRFENPGVPPSDSQNLTIAEAVKGLVRSNLFGRVLPKKQECRVISVDRPITTVSRVVVRSQTDISAQSWMQILVDGKKVEQRMYA
jgi:hypothetical protein